MRLNPKVCLSSLDFTVYAYLKEEMINTNDSAEVKYLKEKCPCLMKFYKFMESIFSDKKREDLIPIFKEANQV